MRKGKEFTKKLVKTRKIIVSTQIETYEDVISPFGGLLAVVKFFGLVQFRQIFDSAYTIHNG